ncbi:hypothetical protein ILUMI_00090 [Ignelater luminosus]|uniref:Uncharacterized protein n=1 Tax=Ignelater luminosus TaxID=2038154 RepID=A0A8K0DL58_IGNLU|nr:hypothetical protein ILUMI_00090 [Ignelater luminosus]
MEQRLVKKHVLLVYLALTVSAMMVSVGYSVDKTARHSDANDQENREEIQGNIIGSGNTSDTENEENEDLNAISKKNTRKRKANPNMWKRNVIKSRRNSGESYQNGKGKTVPTRILKPPCSETCRLKCTSKISLHRRQEIFDEYWGLGDITRQRDFIFKYVDFRMKERERSSKISEDEVKESRRLYISTTYQQTRKKTSLPNLFLSTLCISHQIVKTVAKKIKDASGSADVNRRGKVQCNPMLPDAVKQSIRSHTKFFKPIESHYCR